MRGQQYTVFQMLVWAVIAGAFLVAVYSAYSFLQAYYPPVYLEQLRDLVSSAWKGGKSGAYEPVVAKSVAFPKGATVTEQWVGDVIGTDVDVRFVCGRGFTCGDGEVEATDSVKAIVGACCRHNTCTLWFNTVPTPC